MTKVFVLKDRLALGEVLFGYFGREVKLAKNPKGAPYIENSDKEISLSHKGNYLVVALSDKKVGVDLEKIYAKDTHQKIASRYFTPMENEYINSPLRFFQLWTRKEALGKLLGIGLNSETIALEVIKSNITLDGHKYFLNTNCEILEGYCISVASEENYLDFSIHIDGK
ncbi:MAG: 4'-phosphopantetheinyl transferase superfamily protein [Clostridia bacterium]|nr:4'-phosphopantetheinyl transferase superfamily protein [Clostridia bacterium]